MIAHYHPILAAPMTQKRTTPGSGVCSLPALANTHWPLKPSAMMRLLERDKRFKPTFVYPSLLEAQNRAGQPLVRARVSGFCRVRGAPSSSMKVNRSMLLVPVRRRMAASPVR